MLTTLDKAVKLSGLAYTERPGWRHRKSPGGENYQGVSIHHTGSYDAIGDTSSDLAYADWMFMTGRPDLSPPLCNLALSAEGHVYVGAAGNANGVGYAKASGPMPQTSEGNGLYIVIEAMNDGTQGWASKAWLADGTEITYWEAYVRLCAALCLFYKWPASHVRAHKETSITGKWDPGMMNMSKFRADVARMMIHLSKGEDDDMPYKDWPAAHKEALVSDVTKALLDSNLGTTIIKGVLQANVRVWNANGEPINVSVRQAIARSARRLDSVKGDVAEIERKIDEMNA